MICLPLLLLPLAADTPATWFISPRGNDHWSGKLDAPNAAGTDGPFATLERARDAVREAKQPGAVVEIRGGRYQRAERFELTAEDSGTTYRARAGEQVVFNGGTVLKDWQPVTDPAVRERLQPEVRELVREADLKALGVTEYGDLGLDVEAKIQLRLASIEGQGEYTMGASQASAGKQVKPRLELFFNGQPMTLSRWPNDGSIKITEILGKTIRDVRGSISCLEGDFVYDGERPNRWVDEPDPYVNGSWCRDWAEQVQPIVSIDPAQHRMTLKPPNHYYGYKKGQWFYGLNLLSEIDEPGEWYLDRTAGKVYFLPTSDLQAGRAEVSLCPGFVTIADAHDVILQGLQFEVARGTGVTIRNGEGCRVVGCSFRNLANHGVVVDGGHRCRVVGCDMSGLGGGGIYLVGGDKHSLERGDHLAENNHIHHYARWDRMYRPGVMLQGVGNVVRHNLIHDAPHSGIIFGGNDHTIELNEIHSVCFDSNDCGAIYTGRSWTLRGTEIRYNYLHHCYGRPGGVCRGIYLDDLFSSAKVYGNVFRQVTYAVFLGGGRRNEVESNVFIDCPSGMHIDSRGLGWCGPHADGRIKEAREKGTIHGIKFSEPPYSTRYPDLLTLLDDEPKAPKYNTVRRNIFWAASGEDIKRVKHTVADDWWNHIDAKAAPLTTIEDNLVNVDPKFVDEAAGNYQLAKDSPAWAIGFERIPFEQIGLQNTPERASWPVTSEPRPMPEP